MSIVPSSLKVVELRKELSSRGLPTKGKKKDLVKRLEKALANNQPTEATNVVNETSLNDQNSVNDEEKPSEVTSEEKVKSVEQETPSDKPSEETIQQNVEPPAPTQESSKPSVEITSEQKVEPTPTLLGDKLVDATNDQQQTSEPIIETPQPQEPTEKPVDIILNNNNVEVEVIEQPKNDSSGVSEKPQEPEKPSSIEKPLLSDAPVGDLMTNSLEELIDKPIAQLLSNPLGPFIPSTVDQSQQEDDDLMGHREAVSMAREQMVTPPKDDLEIKMSSTDKAPDTMLFDEERGTKRKMDDELHGEQDKKQKTTLADGNNGRLLF